MAVGTLTPHSDSRLLFYRSASSGRHGRHQGGWRTGDLPSNELTDEPSARAAGKAIDAVPDVD
jgi:hypothetical protein